MLGRLAVVLVVGAILSPASAETAETTTCRGYAIASFEEGFPDDVRRYDFSGDLLKPFLTLWQARPRPKLPVLPEHVHVYALPGQPYVVGYGKGACMVGLLKISRRLLRSWLRPRLGHPV